MASTSPTSVVVFKGSQTEILALVNPKSKWREVQQALLAQVPIQHRILPQLRLRLDLQFRACGAKTLAKLEKDLRKLVGDNVGIMNYRIRDSRKAPATPDTAAIFLNDLAPNATVQTTKDVVIVGSVPEGARVETAGSCFVFGSIRGTVEAGKRSTTAVITCLEVGSGASVAVSGSTSVLHLVPPSAHRHVYVLRSEQNQLIVETRPLD